MEYNIQLFGAFRNKHPNRFLTLHSERPLTVNDIKSALKSGELALSAELVDASVLATKDDVLNNDAMIQGNCDLALLPPVCGG